jgi:hypothetical protein
LSLDRLGVIEAAKAMDERGKFIEKYGLTDPLGIHNV